MTPWSWGVVAVLGSLWWAEAPRTSLSLPYILCLTHALNKQLSGDVTPSHTHRWFYDMSNTAALDLPITMTSCRCFQPLV